MSSEKKKNPMSDLMDLLSKLDSSFLGEFTDEDFDSFGLKTSHTYRAALFEAKEKADLSYGEFMVVVMLATAIKSKKRVLAAMTRFKDRPWYDKVKRFYEERTVQYTSELVENRVAVVHIPSCVPNLAAMCWISMRVDSEIDPDAFVNNLWFSQLRVVNALKMKQKNWEASFWGNVVKKGSAAFEKQGFNESYWNTKAADSYPLITFGKSGEFIMREEALAESELKTYLDGCRGFILKARATYQTRQSKDTGASAGAGPSTTSAKAQSSTPTDKKV